MAGLARPSDDILIGSGLEGNIELLEHNIEGRFDNISSLLDGNINKHTVYGCLLYTMYGTSYFTFKTKEKINLYAYGVYYSDSAGSTQKKINLAKLDTDNKTYNIIASNSPINDRWVLLFKDIKPGTYRIIATGQYTSLSELFIEKSASFLIKQDGKFYNVDDINYSTIDKMYNSLTMNNIHDDIIHNTLNLDDLSEERTINEETFKPINKFNNFSIIKLQ